MYQDQILINDFEFYYLVELTRKKIKPLSRFEKPLNTKMLRWLRRQGFHTELIRRKLLSRNYINETVFSNSLRYTDLYKRKFDNTFLMKNDGERKLEGFFFGYPSCCVEQFIIKPYTQNTLTQDDQSLFFHWACPKCRITPELLPLYKQVHKDVKDWFFYEDHLKKSKKYFSSIKLPKLTAAVLMFTGLLSAQSNPDTTHFIPLPGDINQNGLCYAEEIYLGILDYGTIEDCQTYAKFFKAIIDTLPDTIQVNKSYKIDNLFRGVVPCPKCGEYINMGYVTVVNPKRSLAMDIPYLGIHFMEHGFFSYGNNDEVERVDIDTLKRILSPFDSAHLLPVANDSDADGLTDAEEDSLWIYTIDNNDFDNDGVPDGAQIAEELIRLFPQLKENPDGIHSNIEFKRTYGLEDCQICGSTHNMGTIEISNPENKRKYEIPFLSLHAMAHGSFAFNGTAHENGRLNVIHLYRTMKTHMLTISEDMDNDGLKDDEEIYFGFDPKKMDSNNDGVSDGMELALTFADSIRSLPTEPSTTESFVERWDMDGIRICAVCGKDILMGLLRIFNPLLNTIDPLEISYYAYHFLEQGSFACGGAEQSRIDPVKLSHYLNILPTNINAGPVSSLPERFILEQNFPNPFNSRTIIKYRLSGRSSITLKIYNTKGQEIKTLVHAVQSAGPKSVTWYGTNNNRIAVGTGIYIYRLNVGNEVHGKKMLLLK